jgi:hypothetical protein
VLRGRSRENRGGSRDSQKKTTCTQDIPLLGILPKPLDSHNLTPYVAIYGLIPVHPRGFHVHEKSTCLRPDFGALVGFLGVRGAVGMAVRVESTPFEYLFARTSTSIQYSVSRHPNA